MKKILILPGDGIGKEVTPQGVHLLQAAAREAGLEIAIENALIGGAALAATGNALTTETID